MLETLVQDIARRRSMSGDMRLMMQRRDEFQSPLEAQLTGIAVNAQARAYLDQRLDAGFARVPLGRLQDLQDRDEHPEVIIGSGYHAAAYAATRVRMGFPKPLVLERGSRAGGVFAQPGGPAFYLNSRNRAGGIGLSGDQGANLNYLPGAPIQTSSISVGEYQTNEDMALVIRLTLAEYARVATQVSVVSVIDGFPRLVEVENQVTGSVRTLRARRIIDARGLGDPRSAGRAAGRGTLVLTFPDFMQRMATQPWPLRGVRRAAVIGGGDAARCAIEALLGLGPQPPMSIPMLDTVDRIDAYGDLPDTCDDWAEGERGRYKPIGRFLRPDAYGRRRLVVTRTTRASATALPDSALVGGRSYDLVVAATGSRPTAIPGLLESEAMDVTEVGDQAVGRYLGRVYRVGPAADLPFTREERNNGVSTFVNNRAAMFRLGSKTAALAATLSAA